MAIDFDSALNPEQLAAATGPDGPLLVLAAAGTGKTRTLVYRVAYLTEQGIPPGRILLLTFTNRAAKEMLERAQTVTGMGVGGIWGGTFHHLANRLLRRHASQIGYASDYTILDRDDSRNIVNACTKELGLQSKDFPKAGVLLGINGAVMNTEGRIDEIIDARLADAWVDPDSVKKVLREYDSRKRKMGAMDFDDLLVNCVRLLRDKPEILGKYQEQFLHVLVDEYQDTNPIQAELVDRLAGQRRNILVVGDDFQCIYSWRGADFRNIMTFPERYPDAQTYKLETNYRSVPEVLSVANACIARNTEQFQKTLRPTRSAHKRPVVSFLRDGSEQARYVVEQVGMMRREGHKLSEMAVLYRAHFHALELELELKRQGVPYQIVSGIRFFEQAHVKDVCSVLRVLVSPRDEMAFDRFVRLLPSVGERTAAKIWTKMGGAFDANDADQRQRLRHVLPAGAVPTWDTIEPVLKAYREESLQGGAGEIIHRFCQAFYEPYAHRTFEEPEERLDDIRELAAYTSKFDDTEAFLSDIALMTNVDAEAEDVAETAPDTLRLSTVHQAKGLEWAVVFVIWMNDGMFPSSRTIRETWGGESEERRLFYVAVTRAKDELYLCVPEVRRNRDGTVVYGKPSRFILEIPGNLVRTVRPGYI